MKLLLRAVQEYLRLRVYLIDERVLLSQLAPPVVAAKEGRIDLRPEDRLCLLGRREEIRVAQIVAFGAIPGGGTAAEIDCTLMRFSATKFCESCVC
jgi:hypothetical protein